MPLDDVSPKDKNVYIPNDSPDWFKEPSPDRHLCIHDEHQDVCEHFRPPPCPDSVVSYKANDNPSGFMSLQDLDDMNILVDVDFSSDTCKVKNSSFVNFHVLTMAKTDTKVKPGLNKYSPLFSRL